MRKDIRNANAIACKLETVLIRIINNRLEIARKERQKKEEMKEKQKAKAITIKLQGVRERMSSFNKEEDESDIRNDTDLDQIENKYLLQL